jgi:hypothetical protein
VNGCSDPVLASRSAVSLPVIPSWPGTHITWTLLRLANFLVRNSLSIQINAVKWNICFMFIILQTVFARSNAGIMSLNPTQGMVVSLCLFCVCVGKALRRADPRSRSPTDCLRLMKLKWYKTFHGCPMLQSGSNRKRARDFSSETCSYNQLHGAESFLRSRQSLSYSRSSQHFMEPEGSFACSQEPSTRPYSGPDQSSPYHPILIP